MCQQVAQTPAPVLVDGIEVKSINGLPVLAAHKLKYGIQYVTKARTYRDGSLASFRQEYTYVNHETGNVTLEEQTAASITDYSRTHTTSDEYNAKCACCFYGFAHTTEYHNQCVNA